MYGRNYGEKTYRESEEYRELVKTKEQLTFAKGELENVKIKFQNVINNSGNRKQEEMLAEILQIFLADLGLKAAENNQIVALPAKESTPLTTATEALLPKKAEIKAIDSTLPQEPVQASKKFDIKKLKSYEWILANSTGTDELRKNLKNVEIKDLNEFLAAATSPAIPQFEAIYGTYRGQILGVDNKAYGSMLIEINAVQEETKITAKGSIQIFRGDKGTMSNNFSGTSLGFIVNGSSCFVINPGNDNKFYQLYKIKETQQLAGYFYERLAHGTTKTIGSFVLNRTDQFK